MCFYICHFAQDATLTDAVSFCRKPDFVPHPTSLTRHLACVFFQGRAAAELWQLQQRRSEADLHGWPPGGVNAVRYSWIPTQRENTPRYPSWMPPLFILQRRQLKSLFFFLFFLFLAMGLATVEVMQAMQRTWSNSKVRVNGKTRQMQWRDMFDIAVKWRRWGLLPAISGGYNPVISPWLRTATLHEAKINRPGLDKVALIRTALF